MINRGEWERMRVREKIGIKTTIVKGGGMESERERLIERGLRERHIE